MDSATAPCRGAPGGTAVPVVAGESGPAALRVALVYAVLFVVSQVPLYAVQYPDIADFPNHLARFHILEHLGESHWLQRYYVAAPQALFPNLAMELVVPLLSGWLDTALALKIFASLAALLMTSGAIALLERGSTLATVALDDGATRFSPHVGGWAVIDRSVLLSNLYARPFQPVWVAYRGEYVPLARRARTENLFAQRPPGYAALKEHYDYVLIVRSDPQRLTYGSDQQLVYPSSSVRLVRTGRVTTVAGSLGH